MKLSANKNIEQVCVVGTEIPQPIALVVLSDRGKNKTKEDKWETVVEQVKTKKKDTKSVSHTKNGGTSMH